MAYLLVTNDLNPYYRDVLTLMALPHGFRHRFRYERSPECDLVGNLSINIEGQHGLILFRRRSTGQLVPIRRITIERVFQSAHLVVIEFTVWDFPDPDRKQHWNLLERVVSRNAAENITGGVLRPLVFAISNADLEGAVGIAGSGQQSQRYDRWRSVIDSIAGFNFMNQCCFLYLHTIREDGAVLPDPSVYNGALVTPAETSFGLEVASHVLPSSNTDESDAVREFSLKLQTDDSLTVPVRESSAVVSRYDNHQFVFRTKAGIEGVGTSVFIVPNGVPEGMHVPIISLPVYGRFAGWQWFSVVTGVAAYLFSLLLADPWQKILQAVGIILVAAFGKDAAAALVRLIWKSSPIRELRNAFKDLSR